MYRVILFSFFILASSGVCGQITVEGIILDRDKHTPISFANIGIMNSNVGTLSNADGTFQIKIPGKLIRDTLQVSALGFTKKVIPISFFRLKNYHTIYLSEKATMLEAVTVTDKRERNKEFELGNRSLNGGVIEPDTLYAGRSVALLIDGTPTKEKDKIIFPVFLEKARIRILRNNLRSCRFRIRLNEVDSINGQPGDDLLQQSIVVESLEKSGWIEFDLSSLNIVVHKPFFVTFEQILDVDERKKIAEGYREFINKYPKKLVIDTVYHDGVKDIIQRLVGGGIDLPGTFVGISTSREVDKKHSCYIKQTSFSEWVKVHGIMTATVTVTNQKITPDKREDPVCREKDIKCRVERLCEDFIIDSGVNGMQLCISKGNVIQLSGGFGYADVANKKLVTDSTRFRINSVSKSLTSAGLIKLVAEGKLDLDAPVQRYVSFPEKPYPITTRQLAGHLAGFRDYNENDLGDYIRHEHYANSVEALAVFMNDTLLFKPGTQFSYSTFGWNLIGAVIEGASNLNYLDYMQKNIFGPLKMNATCGDIINTKIPNRSKFYDSFGNENDLGDWSYKYAGGGLLSTSEDLVRFGNELLRGSFFERKQRQTLFESQHTSDGALTGYGLGWYIGKDKNGHRIWHHAGDSFSGSSHLLIYPDDDIVIAFLANGQEGVLFDLDAIAALFYK